MSASWSVEGRRRLGTERLLLAPGRALSHGRLHDPAVVLLSCAAAFAVGWAVVEMPTAALLPAAAVASLPLLLSAHARIVFVVFGMLLIFGTSEELTLPKLAYLAGLGVAAGGAIFNVQTVARTPAFHALKPLVLSSFALVGARPRLLPGRRSSREPSSATGCATRRRTSWRRMAPLFALDAYASLSKRALERLLLGAGLLGALSFAVTWMERRGIGTLGLDVLGLPTLLLGAALFAYAMSALIQGDQRRGTMARAPAS